MPRSCPTRQRPPSAIRHTLCWSALCLVALCGCPVDTPEVSWTLKIDFTERSQDFSDYHSDIGACLSAALDMVVGYMSLNKSISIRALVDVGEQEFPGAACGSEEYIVHETTADGNIYQQGLAVLLGNPDHVFQESHHFNLLINSEYLESQMWFDPQPKLRRAEIPDAQVVDAVSIFLHEIIHALAINGWLDDETGESLSPNNAKSIYDSYVERIDGNLYFTGPHAVAEYGSPVPLNHRNYKHYGNYDAEGSDLAGLPMFGEFYQWRLRFELSNLDLAILEDCLLPVDREAHDEVRLLTSP